MIPLGNRSLATAIKGAALAFGLALFSPGSAAGAGADRLPPLNDATTAEHLTGKFIWADLFTGSPSVAAKFYTNLLGWTATTYRRDDGASYILLRNLGDPVAGVVQRAADRPEGPGRWIGYVSVEDVGRAIKMIEAAGGRSLAPYRDLPDRGTQALVADKEGAVFGILHSSSGDPGDFRPDPGDWLWAELFAREPKSAGNFYRSVFNYDVTADVRTAKPDHFIVSGGGIARAGISPVPVQNDAVPSWLGFVRVADLAATVAHAVALGGKALVEPRAAEEGSRFAIVADPTGAAIGLVEVADNAGTGERP